MEKVIWCQIKDYACNVVHNKRWMESYKHNWRQFDEATWEEAEDEFQRSLDILRAVARVCNLDLYCLYKAASVQCHYIMQKHPFKTDSVRMFKRAYENAVLNKRLDEIEDHFITKQLKLASGVGMTWVLRYGLEKQYGTSYKEVTL